MQSFLFHDKGGYGTFFSIGVGLKRGTAYEVLMFDVQ